MDRMCGAGWGALFELIYVATAIVSRSLCNVGDKVTQIRAQVGGFLAYLGNGAAVSKIP